MVTLKDLLTIVSDPFYLNAVSPASGEDSLPEDFLGWEATIQPWDCETLLVTLRQPRRER